MKDEFTFRFLDTDTITVRNAAGKAVTFSILPSISVGNYDAMLARIMEDGWAGMKLVTYVLDAAEPAHGARGDSSTDGPLTKGDIEQKLGLAEDEYDRMYKFARLQLVIAFEERLSKC